MYYGSGNYEAFIHPRKPEGIEERNAYIIGTGIASLTAAFFLVRDAQMPGSNIHLFEKSSKAGGACEGQYYDGIGYVTRGGREMDSHFEIMWDVYRDVPSIETPGMSVLDEYYYLNKDDPNFSLMRVTEKQGQDAQDKGRFALSDNAYIEIMRLFLIPDEELYDKKITDYLSPDVLGSNFWLYWRTMFSFQEWDSALEMKRYLKRYVHHVNGLPDFKAHSFTRYNQYESIILPLIKFLEKKGVNFHFNTNVIDIDFDIEDENKKVTSIKIKENGNIRDIEINEKDLVFIVNGSMIENMSIGSQNKKTEFNTEIKEGGSWDLWRKIAKKDKSFGNPDKFIENPELTNWVSATVTTLDGRIPEYIKKICKRDPFSGKTVTGGIVTVKDSKWLMNWVFSRQPQFKDQKKDQLVGWIYCMFSDKKGNFVKKTMKECTGKEICMEWLYHLGVPEDEIEDMAENSANTVPVMMPFVTSIFMPRNDTDRPKVVPDGSVNFAFLGQYAETPRDTVFSTEYSMRTAMEAVYELLDIERAIPEVWNSTYDLRDIFSSMKWMRDGKKITDMDISLLEKIAFKKMLKRVEKTDIEKLVEKCGLV